MIRAKAKIGMFAGIMEGLAAEAAERKIIMIDATCLKAHRMASSLRAKKGERATSADARSGAKRAG